MDEYVFGLALGLAMAVVNVFKHRLPPLAVPLVSFAFTVGLGAFWGWVFGVDVVESLRQAAIGGAIALGLFAGSDAGLKYDRYGTIRPCE